VRAQLSTRAGCAVASWRGWIGGVRFATGNVQAGTAVSGPAGLSERTDGHPEPSPWLPAPGGLGNVLSAQGQNRSAVGSVRRRTGTRAELRRDESPGCCSGCPARSCCGSTPGSWTRCCSSCRPGSPGPKSWNWMPRPCAVVLHARGYRDKYITIIFIISFKVAANRTIHGASPWDSGCRGLVPWCLTLAATGGNRRNILSFIPFW
jgi:hypothetical protein